MQTSAHSKVQTMRRPARRIATLAAALFGFLAALSAGGCAYFKDWEQLPTNTTDEVTIYVVNHGWHTGIVVNRANLGEPLQFLSKELSDSAYYEFGWGEKDFYQAAESSVWLALQASLWPNDATMHVTGYSLPPAGQFPESETVPLKISTAGLRHLVAGIAASFAEGRDPKSTREGLYANSRFFDGSGKYHLFNTCNTWTAHILGEAGVPTTEAFTLTAGNVMRQSRWAANKYRCCAEPDRANTTSSTTPPAPP